MLSGMLSGEYRSPREDNATQEVEEEEDGKREADNKKEIIEPLEGGGSNNAGAMDEEEEEEDMFEREDLDYLEGSFEFDEMNMEDFVEDEGQQPQQHSEE